MLEGRHLSVAFDGRPVLDDVSLAVASGERVQLAAPSGTGKTTLCRVLAGEVLVDGSPLPRRGPCPVQLIGQHPELTLDPRMRMAASLAECGASEEELGRLRELLGIRDAWLSRYPHELSGGEMQRFCIARALGAHPSYLIADEVSTMLDAVTQAQIWQALVASSSSPIPRPWPPASPPAWWSCQPFRAPSVDSSWMGACLSCAQAVI